jgi:hypothetical protein
MIDFSGAPSKWPSGLLVLIPCALCLAPTICGCKLSKESRASPTPRDNTVIMSSNDPIGSRAGTSHVVVGAVRWDLRAEQEEIHTLLKSNGIQMYVDGSLLYDILVPANQASQALRLLGTNHLFIEGKIRVGIPTNE